MSESVIEPVEDDLLGEDFLGDDIDAPVADNEPKAEEVAEVEQQPQAELTPEQWTEIRLKHLEQIQELEKRVEEAEAEFVDLKAQATLAKKSLEAAQGELNRLIRRGPSRQLNLNFQSPGNHEQAVDEEEDTSWREVSISDAIDLTDKQREKLEEAGVKTVGQFEDLRAGKIDGYPKGLRSIKGFGDAAVDKLEEAILEWWESR